MSKSGISGVSQEEMRQSSFFSSFFGEPINCSEWGCNVQAFPAHTEIYRQGDTAETVYLIERGLVKLSRIAPNGCEIITNIRRRHWFFGITPALLGRPYAYTATTLIRSTLRCLSSNAFLDLVKTNCQFSYQLNMLLSRELVSNGERLEANSCMPARDRLKFFLSELIQEQEPGEGQKLPEYLVPLNNYELAEIIAVTPEYLCRLLKEMEQDRIVRRQHGALVVTDSTLLHENEIT